LPPYFGATILAILPLSGSASSDHTTTAWLDIQDLESAAMLYRLDHHVWPSSLEALVSGDYLKRLPKDPWGHPYHISAEPPPIAGAERGIYIWSYGRDGEPGGSGLDMDVGNWHEQLERQRP